MRLFEITNPPLYLCSAEELRVGETVEQPHACDEGAACEGALEARRPEGSLPRDTTLRLHDQANLVGDHIYLVQPIGQVDRQHTSWLSKLRTVGYQCLGPRDHFASGFWSGVPIPEDSNAPWEYRAAKVKVLKRVGGNVMALPKR